MEILEIISLNWAAAVCLILGLGFVTVELFTPGFGVPGVTGLVLLCLLFTIAVKSASSGALAKSPLILKEAATKQDGYTSGEDLAYFMGKEGEVVTMLRPVGTADFDGVKLEVLSDGGIIETGSRVRVVRVEGRKLVVRKV